MRPIPIAQYLNQFGKATPTHGERLRDNVLVKSRVLSTPADIEGRIQEAFERGKREGLASGRAECEASLAAERRQRDEDEAAERSAWQSEQYAAFADKIERAVSLLGDEIASSVARILKPFLVDERARQVTQALTDNLSRILSRNAPAALKITGPETLLGALRDRLGSHAARVEFVAGEGVDVTVEANHTIIRSQLQPWIDHLESIGD